MVLLLGSSWASVTSKTVNWACLGIWLYFHLADCWKLQNTRTWNLACKCSSIWG